MQTKKRGFEYTERVRGQEMNVVEGLELHTQILSKDEQAVLVDTVKQWEMMGREVTFCSLKYPFCLYASLHPCCDVPCFMGLGLRPWLWTRRVISMTTP